MVKKLLLCLFFSLYWPLIAQTAISPAVQSLVENVFNSSDSSVERRAKDFSKAIATLPTAADKASALEILAVYEQSNYLYAQAADHFSQAALIQGNLELKLQAAVCYVLSGDLSLGLYLINETAKTATDEKLKHKAEVYSLFAKLSDNPNADTIARLRSSANDSRYSEYKASILFALFWVTGDAEAKKTLVQKYSNAPETAIIKNEATVSPVAFWYLMPKTTAVTAAKQPAQEVLSAQTESTEKPLFYQVGIFQTKSYAEAQCKKLAEKNFTAKIKTSLKNEVTFYSVLVPANDSTIMQRLKEAGYEAYPVFE